MVNGRSRERPAHRVASVTSVRPAIRSAPIARLRRAAMTLGPFRVLTLDLSSWYRVSRTFSRGGARLAELDLRVSAGQQLVVMKLPDAAGVVQLPCGVSRQRVAAEWLSRVISSRLAARGGCEFVVAFFELQSQVGGLLFEVGDFLAERVDVGGGAEPGFAPRLFAERIGQPLFELADAGAEPDGAFVGGEQVGLQGCAGDGGSCGARRRVAGRLRPRGSSPAGRGAGRGMCGRRRRRGRCLRR